MYKVWRFGQVREKCPEKSEKNKETQSVSYQLAQYTRSMGQTIFHTANLPVFLQLTARCQLASWGKNLQIEGKLVDPISN